MKNILNNDTVKTKEVFKTKNTIEISYADDRYFAKVNDKNEYVILTHSNPLGTTDFKNESEFILHLEGDKKVGNFIANTGRY